MLGLTDPGRMSMSPSQTKPSHLHPNLPIIIPNPVNLRKIDSAQWRGDRMYVPRIGSVRADDVKGERNEDIIAGGYMLF